MIFSLCYFWLSESRSQLCGSAGNESMLALPPYSQGDIGIGSLGPCVLRCKPQGPLCCLSPSLSGAVGQKFVPFTPGLLRRLDSWCWLTAPGETWGLLPTAVMLVNIRAKWPLKKLFLKRKKPVQPALCPSWEGGCLAAWGGCKSSRARVGKGGFPLQRAGDPPQTPEEHQRVDMPCPLSRWIPTSKAAAVPWRGYRGSPPSAFSWLVSSPVGLASLKQQHRAASSYKICPSPRVSAMMPPGYSPSWGPTASLFSLLGWCRAGCSQQSDNLLV